MKAGWRGTEAFKWMGFVAAIWLQVINGTNFDFSAYSSVLKDVLELDQVQLNNLAVASDLGKALGWISGLASLYLPMWTVLLIAGCLGSVGYGIQWLSLVSKIPPMAYWQAFLLCMLAGNSICWFNTVSYVVCIRNFANKRGFALGLSTSYVGLSAAVYASIQIAVAPRTKSIFLLLNAGVPAIACLLAVPFVGGAPADQKETAQTQRPFLAAMSYGIAIVTGVYMLVLAFVPSSSSSGQLHALILLGLLLAPVSLPTTIFITGLINRSARKRRQALRDARVLAIDVLDEKDVHEPAIEMGKRVSESKDEIKIELSLQIQDQETISPSSSLVQTNSSEKESKYRRAVLGEDHNTIQLLRSIDFWLFFLVYLCGGTLGLVFLNNLGQIAESRGYSKASIFVSLSSSSGFFGRLASSAPDFLLRFKISLPRPAWIGLSMVPMAASFFLLLINDDVALYVGTAILGFFTGMITSIAISITSELFGLKHFGVNHNIVVVNIPLGSLAFGYLAGIFYDETAKKNVQYGTGSTVCHGSHCYNNTFLIWGSVCLIGILLSLILSFRTRTFYQRLHCQNHHLPHSLTP